MEINLEKIELVKERTGASYADAKEALEHCEGSVVDAIIEIEQKTNMEFNAVDGPSLKDSPIFQKMKAIVDKGNITRIVVRKNGKNYVNFPVTVGVAGAILVPWVVIIGVVAALGYQCEIEFIDGEGQVIDINGKVKGAVDKVSENDTVDSILKAGEKMLDKGKEKWEDFNKEGGTMDQAIDQLEELGGKARKKTQKFLDDIIKKLD